MKPRVKAGVMPNSGAPESIAAAGAAETIKDSIERNSVGQGEKGVKTDEAPDGAPTRVEKRRLAREEKERKAAARSGPKQKRSGRLGKEPELPGMPKLDGPGKAGRLLLDAIDTLETAKEAKESAMSNVVKALKAAKRREIRVDGYTITYVHKEAVDRIKISKPKTR